MVARLESNHALLLRDLESLLQFQSLDSSGSAGDSGGDGSDGSDDTRSLFQRVFSPGAPIQPGASEVADRQS